MKKHPIINRVEFSGHGHYKVFFDYYGKERHYITSDMPDIDDYKDDNPRTSNAAAKRLRKTGIRSIKGI